MLEVETLHSEQADEDQEPRPPRRATRIIAILIALLTAVALTVMVVPRANAATHIEIAEPADWDNAVATANAGGAVEAVLLNSISIE